MNIPEALNADFIDAQYRRWKQDPEAVEPDWKFFFRGFETGLQGGPATRDRTTDMKQAQVEILQHRYRELGHLLACMDPLEACPVEHPLLSLQAFGLDPQDLPKTFRSRRFGHQGQATLQEIVQALRETYCRSIGVEYMHLQDPDERGWLQDRMEPTRNRPALDDDTRRRILEKLCQAALFEQVLNRKYVAVTRFSLEGGDAVVPMIDALIVRAAAAGCREVILGMAHRGRLNVLAHVLGKPYTDIFGEFESCYDPEDLVGAGDVKYHNGYLNDIELPGNRRMRAYLASNPSHLEAVSPVVEGIARGRQDMQETGGRSSVLPVLLHGDAAFAGQGVVAETLNMSQLEGYGTGGTIHLIINNQIGYTTLPQDARSSRYATDVAKMLMIPIFHVHGENPEAAVQVIRLALDYRADFGKDVVIDLMCFRRYGHNEGDEPYFTQPAMYERIRQRPSLHEIYGRELVDEKLVADEEFESMQARITAEIETAYEEVHGSACTFPEIRYYEEWEPYHGRFSAADVDTGVSEETLRSLARRLARLPEDFAPHRKLKGLVERRLKAVEDGAGIDWANAEALAFASLLTAGTPVRLSGQDCARGTFSQRHSVLIDGQTEQTFTPLNALDSDQAVFRVYNSLLAEYAVVGFEYGYASIRPEALTMWEAQFGDFVNTAQAVVDLFIASGESKWQRLNGLVLLLPHGYEGMGPEHSSARFERFLQLCAEDNLQVCYPSTPAQYFHLLRRQVCSPWRKPLVVMTPKSLLRHPEAVSTTADLAAPAFREVLTDETAADPRRVLLCSGKIFYELVRQRRELKIEDTAVVRIEQFYPFPEAEIETLGDRWKNVEEWFWVQEEPENMGAWWFLRPRLDAIIGRRTSYVGRPASASPATGFPRIYRQQQDQLVTAAFAPRA